MTPSAVPPAACPTVPSDGPLPRLAIVLSHPIQYYSPWFQWLAAHTPLPFRVFYLWDFGVTTQRDPQFGRAIKWDIDLLSGYDCEFVPNVARDPGTHHFHGLNNPALIERLAAWRPGAVLLFGYAWRSHLRALLWARRRDLPVILRGDSHLLGRGAPTGLRRLALAALLRQFSAFACVGGANRDYYRALGISASRLFFVPHSVNAARFDPDDPAARAAAARWRETLGLGDRRVLLFAGKLQARKQPVELLRAFLAAAMPHSALVFVGDGPLEGELKALAAAHPEASVRFLPFANQTEMPSRYLLADAFALPSRGAFETWGLAVNEAMHLGVPCLVSDVVGCHPDLVQPGRTGWIFPADDERALTARLRDLLGAPAGQLRAMGAAARQQAAGYTYAQTSAGLLRLLTQLPR